MKDKQERKDKETEKKKKKKKKQERKQKKKKKTRQGKEEGKWRKSIVNIQKRILRQETKMKVLSESE